MSSLELVPDGCVGLMLAFMGKETRGAFRGTSRALSVARSYAATVRVGVLASRELALPGWTASLPALDELAIHGTPSPQQLAALACHFDPKTRVRIDSGDLCVALAALMLWPTQDIVTGRWTAGCFEWHPGVRKTIFPRLRVYDYQVDHARDFDAVCSWRPLLLRVSLADPTASTLPVPDGCRVCVNLVGPRSLPLARDTELQAHRIALLEPSDATPELAEAMWSMLARQRRCRLRLGHTVDWAMLSDALQRSRVNRERLGWALQCATTPPPGWLARCLPGLRKVRFSDCAASSVADPCADARTRQVRGCWCTAALHAIAVGADHRDAVVSVPLRVRFTMCPPPCCCTIAKPGRQGQGQGTEHSPEWVAAFTAVQNHPRVRVLID